ncbi:MAG: hypothetical protein SGARI_002311, partial [Bacillariaceae sp.]
MKLLKRKEKFGPLFKTNFLLKPTVFCTSSELIEKVGKMEGGSGGAVSRSSFRAFFPPHHLKLFGKHSLLVQSGPDHTRIRGLVMSSLTPALVNSYKTLVEKSIQGFFDELKQEQTAQDKQQQSEYTKFVPRIRTLFASIMLQVVLGTADVSSELVDDITIWAKGLLAPPLTMIPFTTAGKAMKARKRIIDKLLTLMDAPEDLNEN